MSLLTEYGQAIDVAKDILRRPSASEFMECETCRRKPGSPPLCEGCLHNRSEMANLALLSRQLLQADERAKIVDQALGDEIASHPYDRPAFQHEKRIQEATQKIRETKVPEVVDALDQLAMSVKWEEDQYTDEYKRRVLTEAVWFIMNPRNADAPA